MYLHTWGYGIPIVTEYLILRKSNILWRLHLQWDICFMLEEELASSNRRQDRLHVTLQDQSKYVEKLLYVGFQRASYQFRSPDNYYIIFMPSIKQLK